jgi:Rrf2 family protein
MLRLSKKTDYGLMALIHLAHGSGRVACSAREIARSYDIPPHLMAKVLQKMAQSGIVVSHQGTHGGYSLGRPAHLINAAEVIESIEGPFSMTSCVSETGYCLQFEKCTIKSPLQLLSDSVILMLRRMTVAQMSRHGLAPPRSDQDKDPSCSERSLGDEAPGLVQLSRDPGA